MEEEQEEEQEEEEDEEQEEQDEFDGFDVSFPNFYSMAGDIMNSVEESIPQVTANYQALTLLQV